MRETQKEVRVAERASFILAVPETELKRRCQYCGRKISAGEEKCENC